MPEVPSAVIGLVLDGKGLSEVSEQLGTHNDLLARMEARAAGVGKHIEGWGKPLLALAGLNGLQSVVNKFAQLEGLAASTASSINQITGGPSGYTGIANQFARIQAATGITASDQAGGLQGLVGQVGDHGLQNTSARMRTLTGLASYANAYNTTATAAGNIGGALAQSIGAGPLSGNALLDRMATMSARAGVEGQTAQMAQIAAGLAQQAQGTHPFLNAISGSQTATFAGAFANALRSGGSQWDARTISGAYGGLTAGLQSAPFNPSLQAFMSMAGVNVKDQIAGLGGRNGASTLRKLMGQADRQFGKGSTMEQLFFLSNFGPQAADAIQQLQAGNGDAMDQLLKDMHTSPAERHAQSLERHKRQDQRQSAPDRRLTQAEGVGLRGLSSGGGSILENPLGAAGALGALGALGYGARRHVRGVRAARGAEALSNSAAYARREALVEQMARKNPGMSRGHIRSMLDAELDHGGPHGGGTGLLGKLGVGAMFGLGAYEGIHHHSLRDGIDAMDPTNILPGVPSISSLGHRYSGKAGWGHAAHDLGGLATGAFHGIFGGGHHMQSGPGGWDWLKHATAGAHHKSGVAHASGSENPVERLRKAIEKLTGTLEHRPGGGMQGASWSGGGGAFGAPAVASLAPGTVLASYLGGASGGGGGSFASLDTGGAGGGGGGGSAGGAGWAAATLTWYDPALGGTNSSNGAKNPHSKMANGQPYQAGGMTCAAPAGYAFGTKIAFSLDGKSVTCTVTDRGGAINGNHFDLSRGAAQAIGLISRGRATGKFKVLGGGSGSPSGGKSGASAGSAGGSSPGGAAAAGAMNPASFSGGSGMGSASPWGGKNGVNVYVDGRKIDHLQSLTRGAV